MFRPFANAVSDFSAAIGYRDVWLALAKEDISDQHRRTTLGPVWLLINYLAFTGTFVVIFGQGRSEGKFTIYVATGLLIWLFLSEVITQSVTLFLRDENFIKGTPLPLSIYIMRMSTQSYIRFGYSMTGYLAIVLFSGAVPNFSWLWSALSLSLMLFSVPAAVTIFAIAGVFFPDLQFFVSNIMRIGMFLTPIFWEPDTGGGLRMQLYSWNPFSYFMESARGPVFDGTPHYHALVVCVLICSGMWLAAMWLLGALRKQIVFAL
jgi:ABC-type polysaccharide/polyol phosphate export permease